MASTDEREARRRSGGLAGALDPSFSNDGKVITDVTSRFDSTSGLVLQSDGKIVTAGQAAGLGGRFYLVRYETDGDRDPTFGTNGVVFTNFTPGFDSGFDVELDNNGQIVVAGRTAGSGGRFGLARYDAVDGALDTSFSGNGKVATNFTPGDDFAVNVVVQADDSIVAVGRAAGRGGRFAIARYDDAGTLDSTFGQGGKVLTNFTRGDDSADDIVFVDADTFVVAGSADLGPDGQLALAQYDLAGDRDPAFGGNGMVTTNLTRGLDAAWGVALQGGGIVATGPAGRRVGLVRYDLTGDLDDTFGGGDGITKTDWSSQLDWSDEIAVDALGRIVIVGSADVFDNNQSRYALARYSATGGHEFDTLTNLTRGIDYGIDVRIEDVTQRIVTTGMVRAGQKAFVARHLSG
jgi:uncharacterized delta-60 repeat protein